MSSRRQRVSKGVTNAGAVPSSHRPGTASAQLSARLSNRGAEAFVKSSSTPALAPAALSPHHQRDAGRPQLDAEASHLEGINSLPLVDGCEGSVPRRPTTTAGAIGRLSPSAGSTDGVPGRSGRLFTPPQSSPEISRRGTTPVNGSNVIPSGPLFPSNRKNGVPRSGGEGEAGFAGVVADPSAYGSEGIPLGLHKLSREDLEVYVNVVRATLARQAQQEKQSLDNKTRQAPKSTVSGTTATASSGRTPCARDTEDNGGAFGNSGGRGREKQVTSGSRDGHGGHRGASKFSVPAGSRTNVSTNKDGVKQRGQRHNRRRKQRLHKHHHHHHYHHHHHHHHDIGGQQRGEGGSSVGRATVPQSSPALSSTNKSLSSEGDGSVNGGLGWYARPKFSKTLPLRTLMLDPEVNNIPQVNTQSAFQALVKARNIPHPTYDIDGDGVVGQGDYALAKRFDVNGDGVLDDAEQVVGRRIMAESFLENHGHELHLYGPGLAQKSMATNVDEISRSRRFKKIITGLREKERNFINKGSDGVRDCVTLKPESLTRHNFFSNKFDTTAWNDFTRDPRDADWLESHKHDGSRNQMQFMRKVKARESAQGKLQASYPEDEAYSTRRITLVTDPAVENS